MKKKIVAVLLSMCLVLSMTACGGAEKTEETVETTESSEESSADKAAETETQETETAEAEETTEKNSEEETTAASGSLEAFFETEDGKAMVEAAKSSVGEGMDIEMLAEGNDLVYAYTFDEGTIDASTIDTVSEQLTSAMDSQASTFGAVASQMNSLVGADDCRVVVRYYYDGELLAEGTFEAE